MTAQEIAKLVQLPGGATFKPELSEEEQIKKELANFQSKVGAPANVNYQSATCPIDPSTIKIKELNSKKCSVAPNSYTGFDNIHSDITFHVLSKPLDFKVYIGLSTGRLARAILWGGSSCSYRIIEFFDLFLKVKFFQESIKVNLFPVVANSRQFFES